MSRRRPSRSFHSVSSFRLLCSPRHTGTASWLLALCAAALVSGCPATDNPGAPLAPDPRLALTGQDHVLGNASAAVTVIEYGDFECPVCARFARETFPTIRADYIATGKVRWVFRHFPLRSVHPNAESAAQASECAAGQARFWDYHDALFDNRDALGPDDLKRYAAELDLNTADFSACLDAGVQAARVQRDVVSGQGLGVTGTPTFFINGRREAGFRSAAVFRTLLDNALSGN